MIDPRAIVRLKKWQDFSYEALGTFLWKFTLLRNTQWAFHLFPSLSFLYAGNDNLVYFNSWFLQLLSLSPLTSLPCLQLLPRHWMGRSRVYITRNTSRRTRPESVLRVISGNSLSDSSLTGTTQGLYFSEAFSETSHIIWGSEVIDFFSIFKDPEFLHLF